MRTAMWPGLILVLGAALLLALAAGALPLGVQPFAFSSEAPASGVAGSAAGQSAQITGTPALPTPTPTPRSGPVTNPATGPTPDVPIGAALLLGLGALIVGVAIGYWLGRRSAQPPQLPPDQRGGPR